MRVHYRGISITRGNGRPQRTVSSRKAGMGLGERPLNNHVLHGQDTVHWASAAGSPSPHSGGGRRGKRPPPPSGPMGIPRRCLSLGRGLPLQREKWTRGSRNPWGHQGSQGLPGSRSRAWAAALKPGGPGRWPCLRPALPFSLRICTESPKIYPSLRTPSAPQPPG